MFEVLRERFHQAANQFKGGRLRQELLEEVLEQVRAALLEADAGLESIALFLECLRRRCEQEAPPNDEGVSASQRFLKMAAEELATMMGGEEAKPLRTTGRPALIMLVGLQGAGKTTTCAKLALHLQTTTKKRCHMASTDHRRPAAMEQLAVLAQGLGVSCSPPNTAKNAMKLARYGLSAAKKAKCEVLLLDTAGRLEMDTALMDELAQMAQVLQPTEILYVADGMSGQNAVQASRQFAAKLPLTGCILTKMEGDARGGAAISIRHGSGAVVKFMGVGENPKDLEVFHPQRIASRILGLGDILSLMERAETLYSEEKSLEIQRKMAQNAFTLTDFLEQLRNFKSIGSMSEWKEMLPALGNAGGNKMDEGRMRKMEAMICSMTFAERENHQIINPSRLLRIAKGSGCKTSDVQRLLKRFRQMRKTMKNLRQLQKQNGGDLSSLLGGMGGEGIKAGKGFF